MWGAATLDRVELPRRLWLHWETWCRKSSWRAEAAEMDLQVRSFRLPI